MKYKAPTISKDYTIEWSGDLPTGVTVSACVWTLEDGLTEDSSTVSGTESTIDISGGVSGRTYEVEASATGSDSETYEQVFYIRCGLNIN